MFERFTNRAKKIMALAHRQASCRKHDCIDTMHILLGMIEEGKGEGIATLKELGVIPTSIQIEIDKMLENGQQPDEVFKPQTPGAKRTIEYAMLESQAIRHNYVGSGHLLLGLLREDEGQAARVLNGFGVTLEASRQALRNILG